MSEQPKLRVVSGKVYATSLDVARHFHKSHKHVLRDIERLFADLQSDGSILSREIEGNRPNFGPISDRFGRLNFEPTTHTDNRNRKQPAYNLTRDGFVLLAMGFTGKEALQWKVAYIEAFNLMEAALTRHNLKEGTREQLRLFPELQTVAEKTRPAITLTAALSVLCYLNLNIPPMTREQFKRLLKRGQIEGYKDGRQWVLYQDSFNAWLDERRRKAA
jgi:Rha family phage regulatory protein